MVHELPLGTDYRFTYKATRRSATTAKIELATGLGTLVGRISLSPGGAAIAAGVSSVAITEMSNAPGWYTGVLDASAIDAALTTYKGQFVYEVVEQAGNIRRSTKLKVVEWVP
jgi:hypothetical protein